MHDDRSCFLYIPLCICNVKSKNNLLKNIYIYFDYIISPLNSFWTNEREVQSRKSMLLSSTIGPERRDARTLTEPWIELYNKLCCACICLGLQPRRDYHHCIGPEPKDARTLTEPWIELYNKLCCACICLGLQPRRDYHHCIGPERRDARTLTEPWIELYNKLC